MRPAATGNPIIRDQFTADPTVLVHEDTVFLYTTHDEAPPESRTYVIRDWLCFSSTDLSTWTPHASPLKAADFLWSTGKAFASDVVKHQGRFYWFAAVETSAGSAIGVARADQPAGPFEDVRGSALITLPMLPVFADEKANLDPSFIPDHDGTPYLFWGNKACYYAKLADNLQELDGPITVIDLPDFAEGVHLHKHGEWYYLAYGYGMPEKVAYAMSKTLQGPWDFNGILNEVPVNCQTNRAAILDFKERSYLFYHNGALPSGGNHRRSVCVDYLVYHPDGTLQRVTMTKRGVDPVH